MRSRQNSLPALALASWYLGAPPFRTFSASAFSSSLRDIWLLFRVRLAGLFSRELGGALLGEGAQALVPVLALEHELVAVALVGERLGEGQIEAAVDRALGLRDGQR